MRNKHELQHRPGHSPILLYTPSPHPQSPPRSPPSSRPTSHLPPAPVSPAHPLPLPKASSVILIQRNIFIDATSSHAHSPLYLFGLGNVLFMCSLIPVQAKNNGERLIPSEKKINNQDYFIFLKKKKGLLSIQRAAFSKPPVSLLIEFLLSSAPGCVRVSCLLSITAALPFHMPEIYTIVFRLLVFVQGCLSCLIFCKVLFSWQSSA